MKAKKILSLLLCAVMLLGFMPVSSFADGEAITVAVGSENYSSLDAALVADSTVDGSVVKLLADATISQQLTISKNITLDFNGHSISGELEMPLLNVTAANFTITGSSEKGIVNTKGAALLLSPTTVITVGDLGENNITFSLAEAPSVPVKIATVMEADPKIEVKSHWFSFMDKDGKYVPQYVVIEGDRKIGETALIEGGNPGDLYLYKCEHKNAANGACPDCGTQHRHNWSFEAAENTITAKCANNDSFCQKNEQKISLIYDSSAKAVIIDGGIEGIETLKIDYTDLTAAPTAPGRYTASISIDDVKAELSFTIGMAEASLSPAEANGANGWYNSASLVPSEGSSIAASESSNFDSSMAIADGTHTSLEYWLKAENGFKDKYSWNGEIKLDGTAPVINAEAVSVTDSSAGIKVEATDATSGVASYKLECADTAVTIGELADGVFPISGLTANTGYTLTLTVQDNAGNTATKELSFTSAKLAPSYTAPTANTGLTYNASAQALITAGTATNGEMQYSLDGVNYSTEIPSATAPAKYTVWYKVIGAEGYSDIDAASIEVEISKAQPSYTAPTANTNLTYNASAQALITAGTATNGEMQYSLDGVNYSTEIPSATAPAKYTVWYKVIGAEGYSDIDAASIEVEISKAQPSYTAPTGLTATYGQTLGDISLAEGWTWKDSTATSVGKAGTNKFIAVFTPAETAIYSSVEKELEISVSKKSISISNVVVDQKYYDGQKTAAVSSVSLSGLHGSETLVPGTDFTVSAEFNDANIGENKTVTVTVTLLETDTAKNYSVSGSYTLSNQTITANANVPSVTLSFNKVSYNGKEHKPTVTLKDGNTVIPATEYDVSYSDNTNAGTAKVTITDKAGGNYNFSSLENTFTIEKVKLVIAPKAVTVNRGANAPKLDYTVSGLISGEKIGANKALEFTLYNSKGTEISPANAVKTAGSYTIKWTNMSTIQFSKIENYELSKVETADFIVNAPASSGTNNNTSTNSNSNSNSNTNSGNTNKPNSATSTIKPSPSPAVTAKPSVSVPVSGYTKTIRVDANLDGNTVSINSVDLSKLDSGAVSVDLSQVTSNKLITTLKIPTTVVKDISSAAQNNKTDNEALVIVLGDGTSISFDAEALGGKASQAKGNDISVSVEHASKVNTLTAAQKFAIGGHDAYDISVLSGGKAISNLGGKISIQTPYALKNGEKAEGIVVYYVDENGALQACETSYDALNNQVSWVTDHLSLYMIDYVEPVTEIPSEDTNSAENENTSPSPIDPEKKDGNDLRAILWILLIGFVLMTVGLLVFAFIRRRNDDY